MGCLLCQMFEFHNRPGSVRIKSVVSILGDEFISINDSTVRQIGLIWVIIKL